MSAEERKAVVEARLEKAMRACAEAAGIVPLGYWETIANRLYYAAFDAVSALLSANGCSPQTHSGTIQLFGQRFVLTGLVPSDFGRLFHRLFTLRQTGDYDAAYAVSEEDVRPFVEPTRRMVESISELARRSLDEGESSSPRRRATRAAKPRPQGRNQAPMT